MEMVTGRSGKGINEEAVDPEVVLKHFTSQKQGVAQSNARRAFQVDNLDPTEVKKRLANRESAQRCRAKKLQKVEEMLDQLSSATELNKSLKQSALHTENELAEMTFWEQEMAKKVAGAEEDNKRLMKELKSLYPLAQTQAAHPLACSQLSSATQLGYPNEISPTRMCLGQDFENPAAPWQHKEASTGIMADQCPSADQTHIVFNGPDDEFPFDLIYTNN